MDGSGYDLTVSSMYSTRKGTCTSMCSKNDLEKRGETGKQDTTDIPFERNKENDEINPDLAVSSYRRAAAGQEIPAAELRTLRTLWKATHFLILNGLEKNYADWSKDDMIAQLCDPQNEGKVRLEGLSVDALYAKSATEVAAVVLEAVDPDAISGLRKAREYADRLVAGQDPLGIVKRCTYVSDRFRRIRFEINTQGLRGLAVTTMTERMVRFRIISAFFSTGAQGDPDRSGAQKAWKDYNQDMAPLIEMYRLAHAEGKVECLAQTDEMMSYYMIIIRQQGRPGELEQLLQQPWLMPFIRSPHVQVLCLHGRFCTVCFSSLRKYIGVLSAVLT